jgi:hypothetical protein
MSFTNEDYLPEFEEITVPELEVTSSVLRAGAHHFGKYCDKQCKVRERYKNSPANSLFSAVADGPARASFCCDK